MALMMLLFSATNEDTPYEQLLHYWFSQASKDIKIIFNGRTYILVVAWEIRIGGAVSWYPGAATNQGYYKRQGNVLPVVKV